MFKKITQFLKHHDNSHWAKSTSLLLLRTVQKEFWSVYLKVLEGNIIQQDSNRLDTKAFLKMFPQRHTRNSNLLENILVLKPWYKAMNNKWPVMDCGKIGKNDNRQKKPLRLWKMVTDKSDAQKCVFQTAAHCVRCVYLRRPSSLSEWTKEGSRTSEPSSASFWIFSTVGLEKTWSISVCLKLQNTIDS